LAACSLPAADAMADGAGSSRSAVGPFAFRGAAAGGERSTLDEFAALGQVLMVHADFAAAPRTSQSRCMHTHRSQTAACMRSLSPHGPSFLSHRCSSSVVVVVVISRAHQRCTSQLPRVPPATPAECRKRRCSSRYHLLFFWCYLHRRHVLGRCCLHRKDWCWVARAVSTSRERLSKLQLSSCVCASTAGVSIVDIVASIGCWCWCCWWRW
jgi:hypothetical protein